MKIFIVYYYYGLVNQKKVKNLHRLSKKQLQCHQQQPKLKFFNYEEWKLHMNSETWSHDMSALEQILE